MAGKKNRIEVDVQANTKHFQVHFNKAKASLSNFRKETDKLHGSGRALSKTFQKAANAASVLHGPLNGVSGRLSALSTTFRIAGVSGAAFGGALTAVSVGLGAGLREVIKVEHQMARLEGVLTATGHAAGYTAEAIDAMSRDIAMSTLASSEGVREAAAALATFSSISGDTFERTLRLGQDVAEVMGTNIKGAALQLAKALDAPTLGLNSLRRAGVSFTEQEREKIKALEKSGDLFKAQEIILAAVEAQLGGVAEVVADGTFVGAWDTLGQEVTEFWEALADKSGAAEWFKDTANALSKRVGMLRREFDLESNSIHSLSLEMQQYQKELDELAGSPDTQIVGNKIAGMLNMDTKREGKIKNIQREINARREAIIVLAKIESDQLDKAAAAELLKQQKHDALKLEAAKKTAIERREIEEKLSRMTGTTDVSAAVTKEDAVIAKYDLRYAALEAYRIKVQEEHGTLLGMEQTFEDALTELQANERMERNEAMLEDEDAVAKRLQKIQDDNDKLDEERKQAKIERDDQVMASTGEMFGHLASAMKEGSKEQKAMLVLEKAMAIARVSMSMSIAMGKAMEKGLPLGAMEMATMAAMGAQIIAGLVGISTSGRASGGPVNPGGRYMVGEHGPEILQMGTGSGHIVKNEDISPNLNVSIIESAERAGTVQQDGGDVQVYVAAAMQQLNNDLNSGRGLFAAVENRYGLQR